MPVTSARPVERLDRPILDMPRIDTQSTFRDLAYAALKRAITAMDIYDHPEEIRLDERALSADLDTDKIASVLPAMKKRALEMWEEGERLTGHPGLPLEMTPNLAAAE